MRAAAADGARGDADAGAIHQHVEPAEFRLRQIEGCLNVDLAADISGGETRAITQVGGQACAFVAVAVEDDDASALLDEARGRTGAEAGCATRD